MAESTNEFYIKPQDGWVQILTGPITHVVVSGASRPYALAVGASAPSLADTPASANLSYTGQPADADTITLAGQVYTFKTALTPVAGEVLIGADQDASYANLTSAVNGQGTPGTDYAVGTPAHPSNILATQTAATDDVLFSAGPGDNGIAVSEALTNATFDGAATSLSGGALAIVGLLVGNRTWDDDLTIQLDAVQSKLWARAVQVGSGNEAVRITVLSIS